MIEGEAKVTPAPESARSRSSEDRRLSTASKRYDEGNKGYLTTTEKTMRRLDSDGTGVYTRKSIRFAAEKIVETQKKETMWKRMAITLVGTVTLLVLCMFVSVIYGNEITKESHVTDGEFVAVTKGYSAPIVTANPESYTTLHQVGAMPLEFLNKLQTVAFAASNGFQYRREVTGYDYIDAKHLTLHVGNGQVIKVVDGKATFYPNVEDSSQGWALGASTPESRRMLGIATESGRILAKAFSFDEIRKLGQIVLDNMSEDHADFRRLSTSDPIHSALASEGGFVKAGVSVKTTNQFPEASADLATAAVKPSLPIIAGFALSDGASMTISSEGSDLAFRFAKVGADGVTSSVYVRNAMGQGSSYTQVDGDAYVAVLSGETFANSGFACDPDALAAEGTTCEAMFAVQQAALVAEAQAAGDEITNCKHTYSSEVAVHASVDLAFDNGDGSGVWSYGVVTLYTDGSGSITKLGYAGNTYSVTSIANIGSFSFDMCLEEDSGSDGRRLEAHKNIKTWEDFDAHYGPVQEAAKEIALSSGLNSSVIDAAHEMYVSSVAWYLGGNLGARPAHAGRSLFSFVEFQAWASNTQWCGAGTDIINTPCPAPGVGDYEADRKCRRHDHGARYSPVGPAVRLECGVDHDLIHNTNNWAVQACFGKWGLASVWGCDNYQSSWGCRNCGWRGCDCGHTWGWSTRRGPWRYDGQNHRGHSMYKAKEKNCPNDLSGF